MDVQRVKGEVRALRNAGFSVRYNEPAMVYVKIPFPDGWDVENDWILLKLDRNYPRTPPDPHIQAGRHYENGEVTHLIRTGSEWDQWCMHEFDWNPLRHSLLTMIQLLLTSLNRPVEPNPFQSHEPSKIRRLFTDTDRQRSLEFISDHTTD